MTAIVQTPQPPSQELLTYEAYLAEFLEQPTTTQPYEILDGVRILMTSPLLLHQRIVLLLATLLLAYEQKHHGGMVITSPFDVVIRRTPRLQTRQPDVLFISNERLQKAGGLRMEGPLEIAPELVIEVLSPSETRRSLLDKIEDFRSIGVEECWLVSPQAESVQILRLQPQITDAAVYTYGKTLQSLVFPDLTLKLSDIFAF